MKLKIFFLTILVLNSLPSFPRLGVVRDGRGQIINCSGKAQPNLVSFFGVEVGVTSFNVSKAILDERYGTADYISQSGESWCLAYNRVFWYDQPVSAWFYFKSQNGKRVLDFISVQCDKATTLYIANQLNKDYGKGDCDTYQGVGAWGYNISGQYAIETDYYTYPSLNYRGFFIRSN